MIVGWESSSWVWNDFGHATGAFLTSPGAAAVAALIAAGIAAKQVVDTRSDDKTVGRRQELWKRFEWVATHRIDLGAAATARMLVAIENEAKVIDDDNLRTLIAAHRRSTVRQAGSSPN